jgi:hypothetical protein
MNTETHEVMIDHVSITTCSPWQSRDVFVTCPAVLMFPCRLHRCRELRMKSPLEKLHSRALQLARGQSALAVSSSSGIGAFIDGFHGGGGGTALATGGKSQDEAYLDALQSLLREYIDQLQDDSLLDGVSAA